MVRNAIPIFVILMFFSMQLVTLPKQMLPKAIKVGFMTLIHLHTIQIRLEKLSTWVVILK